MRHSQILKRVIPFIGAFIIGLFIASFFVVLPSPKLGIDSEWGQNSRSSLRVENRRLKRENCRLKWELRRKARAGYVVGPWLDVPPPPPVLGLTPSIPEPPHR